MTEPGTGEPAGPGDPAAAGDAGSTRPPNAFTVPAFRALWASTLTYQLVNNAQRFTFGWLVLDGLGRSEGWQGFVAFTLGLPVALLVLHAGAWADRVDRWRLLATSQFGAMAVMAATTVLVATDRITLPLIVVLTLGAGVAQAIGQPVRAALIPVLVDREQLYGAIALNAIAITMSLVLGPLVAKVAGDAFGFEGAFGVQTALLGLGGLFLLGLHVPAHRHPRDRSASTVRAQIGVAVAHVRRDVALRKLFVLLIVAGLTVNAAVMVTLQALVKDELGRDSGDAGPLLGLLGLGIAVTSVIVMRRGDMPRKGTVFMRAMMVGSTMVFLMGQAPSYLALVPLTLGMGLAGGFYITMNQGLIQGNTPEELMGRVMALFTLVQLGLTPVGALVLGLLAEVVGTGTAMSGAAASAFAVVIVVYRTSPELRELS